jgi:apolipoprotein N-acyltransferase
MAIFMQINLTQKIQCLALLAGGLLPLAFAPLQWAPLALLSPAFLLWGLQETNSKSSTLKLGFYYGMGCFGVGVSWIFVSIHTFGQAPMALAALITLGFVLFLSLSFVILGFMFKKCHPSSKTGLLTCVFFPSLWVLLEWSRSSLGTGFPWLLLGYSQTDTPLGGFAPLGGVYLVSWISCFLGSLLIFGLLASAAERFRRWSAILATFCLVYGMGYALQQYPWTDAMPNTPHYQVSLVQGNLRPDEKFPEPKVGAYATLQSYGLYYQLTRPLTQADFVVWPENAVNVPRPQADPILKFFTQQAQARNQTWIMGIPIETPDEHYYNSLVAVGVDDQTYHKTHLVPFGEYVPFEAQLRGLIHFFDLPMSDFVPHTQPSEPLNLRQWKAAPFICYEIAFADKVRASSKNANILLNISEDGWFGNSLGPHQHLQIARMRSLENAKPLLRATTSGISAFINEKGKIIQKTPQFTQTSITQTMTGFVGQTPWVKIGLWPLLIFCGFMVILQWWLKKH